MKSIKNIFQKNKKIIIILIAIFVTIAINIPLDINDNKIEGNTIQKVLVRINDAFEKQENLGSLFTFLGLLFLFSKTLFKEEKNNKRSRIYKIILPLLFTIFVLIGISYSKTNSWDLLFNSKIQFIKAIIVAIGYYIIFKSIINFLFDQLLDEIEYKESKNKLFNIIFEKHSFILPVLIILICWLPYIIIYFPGILMPDSSNQIKQFFGLDISVNSATNSMKLIDENVKITNHHPVLHTVLLGICMQFGKLIGNDNIGVFLCSLIQILLLATAFGTILNFMKKVKTNNWTRIIALLIFSLLPIFPFYALEITKDVPFTAFLILYVVQLYSLVKKVNTEKIHIRKVIDIIAISLCLCFSRNNGIYVILFSLPLLFIISKINRKKIVAIVLVVLVINKCFTSIILPAFKIPTSSTREMLSIPFQQTARYVKEHKKDVTEEEKIIIDKVLIYDTLSKRYNPVHADAVKNKYNKDSSKEDLKNYFKVWLNQFFKHPTTYVQATLNNYYGYIYPEATITEFTTKYTVTSDDRLTKTGKFNYYYIEKFETMRSQVKESLKIIQKLPVISWITNIGLNVWAILVMITYLCYKKKYKYIICFMPIVSIILVGFASPVNAYFRYAMPYVFALPLTISMFLDIIKKKE